MEGTAADAWERTWVEVLRFRWARFEARLDARHLRAYLEALPDFDDVVAERKALDHALAFPHVAIALRFFIVRIRWVPQRGRYSRGQRDLHDGYPAGGPR